MDNRRKPIPEAFQCRITKIFVTNLPEGCSGADLASHVRVFGQIYDLYIARKRDKMGNRFGFLSMLDVKDKSDLLKNLRNIRMGNNKLWFNIARFVLEDGEINVQRGNPTMSNPGNANCKDGTNHMGTKFASGEFSFKDMLVGKTVNVDHQVNGFSSLNGRAIVGRMVDVEAMKSIYLFLHKHCSGYGNVQYLGGLELLISFDDQELALLVLEAANKDNSKFSSACLWRGQSLSYERLAWLNIKGIPLHLFTHEIVNLVGGTFGKVVYKAAKMESDPDLSFDYVGILVSDGKKISEEVNLEWKKRKFRVWVGEEMGDWIPDFYPVKTLEDQESSENSSDKDSDEDVIVEDTTECEPAPETNGEINGSDADADFSDKIDDHINEGINDQSNALNEELFSTFVPAANFNFEHSLGEEPLTTDYSKVVKRKKSKKSELGRASMTYTSSNESQRVVKKPKKKNSDMFGLNGLLGISDSDTGSKADNTDCEDETPFDLNTNPVDIDCSNIEGHVDTNDLQREHKSNEATKEDEVPIIILQRNEAEATKTLGSELGVDLARQDKLILDSIIVEGLQKGIK
ncbi:nucleotide-binding alpha-beta plait domain-containing protein [Artemisia annua]|uniref:Nucleotide-binding alpha-beta plait domain-containing protein n=1 Tax=Artemisia annua TaxID=35608 RepID=A0A2U1LI86_ARTAN|nr:nucleotide-binding alpha-beta plait domain-containing protein [Artemisia annua]